MSHYGSMRAIINLKYRPFLILDLLVGAYESMAAIQLWYVNLMVLISSFILLTGNSRMSIGPILLSVFIGQCYSPKCLLYRTCDHWLCKIVISKIWFVVLIDNLIFVMKKKFKQWWSSIPLISTERTITFHHVYDFQMSCWWCNINKSNFIWKWIKKKFFLISYKIWLNTIFTRNQRRWLICPRIVCNVKWFVIMPSKSVLQCTNGVVKSRCGIKQKKLSGNDLALTLLGWWMFRHLYILYAKYLIQLGIHSGSRWVDTLYIYIIGTLYNRCHLY